ncbi:MAG: beta-propeller domain-containing protein [Planctomycetota bacterium]|jgi:hypothetical protein
MYLQTKLRKEVPELNLQRHIIVLSVLLCMLTVRTFAQEAARPKMLIAATGLGALIIEDGKVTSKFPTRGSCQDAWMLENGDVLVTETIGVTKFDKDGKVLMRYTAANKKNEVHACQPLPKGRVLVAQSGPARLLELDAIGKIVKEVAVKDIKYDNAHLHMRGVRKNKKGEYGIISSGEMRLIILKADGTTKRIVDLQKLPKNIKLHYAHSLAFLDNGNILVSTSYGSCFVELDPDGKVVWSLTPQDLPELKLTYAAGMQRLANDNTICTAYKSSYPIFEVTPDKKIVWKISASKEIGYPLHVQVIKENDKPSTFKLHK